MLNKQTGNMYPWVTHTWNPIRGRCPHECSYCYMKRFDVGELRLDRKALKDNLGEGNVIFVGSSVDVWAEKVPSEWISTVLDRIDFYPKNTYLFQTKNPDRFDYFKGEIPSGAILGTTIESDLHFPTISKAPDPHKRAFEMASLEFRKMVSIEPIMKFTEDLIALIEGIQPEFVSIGADSQGNDLPEPSPKKVKELIKELEKFTEVRVKGNLKRLVEREGME